MVVILYDGKHTDIAEAIRRDLLAAFSDHVQVELIRADVVSPWPGEVSWDDLLIVVYGGEGFPDTGSQFITQYLKQRPDSAMLLPVSVDPAARKPPEAAAEIKALPYDEHAKDRRRRLTNRAGAMLGLRIQGRDSKIFISYRASDGTAIAEQLYAHLTSLGHRPFLDEAVEIDGDTKILPGTKVQNQIDEALKDATLMLLIDTPDAPGSRWIKHEILTAGASLLPILPICFRDVGDKNKGPRFRSLLALQRWVQLPSSAAKPPLTDAELDEIQQEAELYMCEIFKRKLRVPFVVKKEFSSRGFLWEVLDQQLLMFLSSKLRKRFQTRVLSHCSLFDPSYTPAMRRFADFFKTTAQSNFNLFIYDGELLPEPELQDIIETLDESNIIILHHQELAALIDSNFTMVGGP
jgi:hypothetical protein